MKRAETLVFIEDSGLSGTSWDVVLVVDQGTEPATVF